MNSKMTAQFLILQILTGFHLFMKLEILNKEYKQWKLKERIINKSLLN